MKVKHSWLLFSAIFITASCLIVERTFFDLPDYVEYIVAGVAIAMVIIFSIINKEVFANGGTRQQHTLRK